VSRVEGDDVGRLTDGDGLSVDGDIRETSGRRARGDEYFETALLEFESELAEV